MPAIALDVMSGDNGLAASVAAACHIKKKTPGWDIILVGDEHLIKQALHTAGANSEQWQICHTSEVISMDEMPTRAIRRRNTSMRRALELVAEKKAVAAVSAGNTGALMGLGVLILRVIDGISRPAIASFIPNRRSAHSCCMLDLGANIRSTPEMLRDFALMGSALVQAIKKKENPSVGLLNIGEEIYKGDDTLKRTGELLQENPHINFAGNVEGYTIYSSGDNRVDVVVCDGFNGNIALKVSEGLAAMMVEMMKDVLRESWLSKICAVLAYPLLSRLRQNFDHRQYNGASFLGLRGVLVKSHGNADKIAFAAAIEFAINAATQDLPGIIARNVAIVSKTDERESAKESPPLSQHSAPAAAADEMDGLSVQAQTV